MSGITPIDKNGIADELDINRVQVEEKDDKNHFLELLVAQLENQNPLEPQDGADFLAQLAQFSTVDGIERLNSSVDAMASNLRSGQALQATALVGRKVQVPTESGYLEENGSISGLINAPNTSDMVMLSILTPSGDLVREISLDTDLSGQTPFIWDGLDNDGVKSSVGEYKLLARTLENGEWSQAGSQVDTNVDSVTIEEDGSVILNLRKIGSVALNDIVQIH